MRDLSIKELVFSISLKILGVGLLICALYGLQRTWPPKFDLETYDLVWYWGMTLLDLGLLSMAYIFIRYSSLIASEFGGSKILLLFLALSILAAIFTPLLSFLWYAGIPFYVTASILITTVMTFITHSLKNQLISWFLTLFFSVSSFEIVFIYFWIACRGSGSGGNSWGAGLILIVVAALTVLVSIVVNTMYKMVLLDRDRIT